MVAKVPDLTLDDLLTDKGRQKPCKTAELIAQLSENDRKVIEEAMSQSMARYPHLRIAEALSARVESISANQVGEHRKHKCSCAR